MRLSSRTLDLSAYIESRDSLKILHDDYFNSLFMNFRFEKNCHHLFLVPSAL